jgi:SAM-dependent methyltransferase
VLCSRRPFSFRYDQLKVYTFKASPYSSHSLLLRAFPAQGNGRTVLDVGCGNGYLGELLAERGYLVTGIERTGGWSSPFPDSVRLIEADLEQGLPPMGTTFDYVLCADILEHLRRPEAMLRRLKTVTRPGGMVVASLPNSGNVYFRLNILAGRFPQHDKGLFDRTHVRFYTWRGWASLFRESGWEIQRVESSAIPVGLVAPPEWEHAGPVRLAERLCYGLAKIRKTLFAYQFIVIAQDRNKGPRE